MFLVELFATGIVAGSVRGLEKVPLVLLEHVAFLEDYWHAALLIRLKHLVALRRESVPSEALVHRFVLLKLPLRQLLILLPLYELVSELLQNDSFMRLNLRDRFAGRGLPVELALDGVEDLPGASGRLLELLRLVEDD